MPIEFLYRIPAVYVLIGMFVAFFIASVLGYRLGISRRDRKNDDMKEYIGTVQGIAFSILGLLLGFTLSVGISRYDKRRELLVEDANAVGTSYLRSRNLPEPFRTEIGAEFKRYIEIRIQFYEAGRDAEEYAAALQATDESHYRLWAIVERLTVADSDNQTITIFIESVNELIDAHGRRVAALSNQIPSIVIYLLIAIAMLALFLMNIRRGMLGERRIWMQLLLTAMIAAILVIIIDLDRPRNGFTNVPDVPMNSLKQFVEKMPPSAGK